MNVRMIHPESPLAETPEVARQIVELASANDAPLLSCSSFRWCDAAREMRAKLSDLGTIELLSGVSGQGKFHIYAIHPTEFAYGILGAGVTSVINVGEEDRDVIRMKRADGAQIVMNMFFRDVIGGGQMFTVCGQSGWHTVDYLGALYHPMMEEFLAMARSGEMPVPGDEMVEVIAVIDAARRSREQGGVEIEI